MKKIKWKKVGLFFFSILLFLLLIFFSIKNSLFNYIVKSKIDDFNHKYYSNIKVQSIQYKGINTFYFNNFVVTLQGDTICEVDTIHVKFNFFKAIVGEVNIKQLFVKNVFIKLNKTDSTSTIQMLLKTKKEMITDTSKQVVAKYNARANLLFKVLFNLLPNRGKLENINIQYFNNGNLKFKIFVPFAEVKNKILKFPILISDNKNRQAFVFASLVNKNNRNLHIKCISRYEATAFFPGFSDAQLKIHFDTAEFSIIQTEINKDIVLKGSGGFNKLMMQQPRISLSEIEFDLLKMNYEIIINENSIILDSTSSFTINKLSINPFIQYENWPNKKLKIFLNEPNIDAEGFFASLPQGLFPNTNNIKATGKLDFRFNFELNFDCIDSLKLDSELKPKNFKILSFGNLDVSKLNSDFVHTVYEKGEPVENIYVSYSNHNYVPFQNISLHLKNALLCTEDGAFFWHKGFIQDAFREAMIENIKRKRFVRGGSTITMQLVKNLYLNRHKVISRKLEEMLIVWLIENYRLASKERMFELYLNIIEFGPLVYGISKGSQFYFQKKPSEITLPEAIFLASIVPKPKHFIASFDSTGNLKPNVQEFMKFVAQKMLNKQMISEQEFSAFMPHVELRGDAKQMLEERNKKLSFKNN